MLFGEGIENGFTLRRGFRPNHIQDTQWRAMRRAGRRHKSVIGALFGEHPYKTLGELHLEKGGVELPGAGRESVVMRRGKALEPVVAAEVAKLRPDWTIEKADVYLRDPAARIGATPDYFVRDANGRPGILQCKTVAPDQFKKQWTPDWCPFWMLSFAGRRPK